MGVPAVAGLAFLALLWPRYGLNLDQYNAAVAGSTYSFDLSFLLQDETAPKIGGVTVEASAEGFAEVAGMRKLGRYGADVLAICAGRDINEERDQD